MLSAPRSPELQALPRIHELLRPLLVLAAIWLGGMSTARSDEPKQSPAGPEVKKRTPAEEAKLDEAKKLNARVVALCGAGKITEAIPLGEKVVEIRKQVLGENHPDYATSLDNLAALYWHQVDYAKSESLLVEALAIRKQALGEKHPDYARSLNNLAGLYWRRGNYTKAEPLLVEALAIKKQALGEKHPDYAASMSNLATLYDNRGNYAKAELLFVEALAITKQVLGEKHPDYATGLSNLAKLYWHEGNYAKAELLFVEALAINKQVLGEKHPDYARSLNNLAALYEVQGNYAKAEPLYLEALGIYKQVLGEKHPDYANSLSNLAALYRGQGNYAKAEPLLVEALTINKQALGEKHPEYATSLNNLAALYRAQGNYAKGEPLLVEALAIMKQALGVKHPEYANNQNNLALLYLTQGNYTKAEPLLVEALAIRKQVLGEKHPEYAVSLNNLAGCELGLRSFDAAAKHASRATEIIHRHLDLTSTIQSEHQQLLMVDRSRAVLNVLLSTGRAAKSSPESVYDQVLAWKGAVTGRQAFLRTLRRALANQPESAKLFSDLESATRELAVLTNLVPKEPDRQAHYKRLNELSDQVEDLQKKLANVSAPFAEQRARQRRTSAELRQTLPVDAALVDLMEYNDFGWRDENTDKPISQRRVTVFVVRRDKPVVWVDLGPSAEINSAIETWRKTYGAGHGAGQAAEMLRRKVWLPLESDLAGATTVLISPDGELAKFPWGALPGQQSGTYLIEERAIAVIPVPQALPELLAKGSGNARHPGSLPKGAGETNPESLLLVGDVDYDGDPGVMLASDRGSREVRDGQMVWDPLPGTRTEISIIRDSFERRFAEGKVQQLREQQATVGAVRSALPNYRYLHFATHGFFADPSVRSLLAPTEKPESSLNRDAMRRPVVGEHPGLLSGIVLTGANRPPAEGKDDGILTALEVGELDLQGVEFVTLSACETGLGATAGGEGLLGLQRAFQTAGARTTVATLWMVRDDAAQRLMTQMYENIWTKRMSKLEALRQAQLSILHNGFQIAGERPDQSTRGGVKLLDPPVNEQRRLPPYYWAAFVLSGDWR